MKNAITIETTVNAPMDKVWKYWNEPTHITKWCAASPEWHAPAAENDLMAGGKFTTTMAAKDGSMSFYFWGIYDQVKKDELIEYTMGDGRKAQIFFRNQEMQQKLLKVLNLNQKIQESCSKVAGKQF